MRQITLKKPVASVSSLGGSVRVVFAATLVCFMSAASLSAQGSTNVFNDAVFWFRGGKDLNGDGYMQKSEFFDDLHADDENHANHKMSMTGFSQNAGFVTEQVVFPALGTNVVQNMQVLHIDNKRGSVGGELKYHPLAVDPYCIFSSNHISNEYTIVSRIRLDNLDRMETLFRIGYNESSKQGMLLGLAQHATATRCKYITGFRTASSGSANKQFKLEQLLVPTNTWVDVAVVVGNGRLRVGVAIPESLASPNVTNTIAFAETPMWTDNCPLLEDSSYYKLFHLNGQENPEMAASTEKYFFVGSVQQIAIWDRSLSDQEVMAAFGMPRPAIFRTGFDNGDSNEFGGARSGSSQTIDGLGSWQNVANTMKAGDTWTVKFTALRDEAGLPQIFSIKSLPESAIAMIEPILNDTSLGVMRIAKNGRAFWPVPKDLITAGENTLVIERKNFGGRDFKMDAMELGGSLGVGRAAKKIDSEMVNPDRIATGVPSAADPNPQHWPLGFQPYINDNTNLYFNVWVDPDAVGVCTSRFWTCVRCFPRNNTYTVTGHENFTIFVNGDSKTNCLAKGVWTDIELNFEPGVLLGGWNKFEIRAAEAYQVCYWAFDRYRFETVLPSAFSFPPVPGLKVILR